MSEGENGLVGILEEKEARHPDYILQADTQKVIQDLPPENISRLFGIGAPIGDPFRAWKPHILMP